MSLKRRNTAAWLLLALIAVCWTYGLGMVRNVTDIRETSVTMPEEAIGNTEGTTYTSVGPATNPVPVWTVPGSADGTVSTSYDAGVYDNTVQANDHSRKVLGFLLCFAGMAAAVTAVFILWQQEPLLGPDGAAVLLAVCGLLHGDVLEYTAVRILLTFTVSAAVRELWGWIRGRLNLSWCLVHRLAGRCRAPQLSLCVYVGWTAAAVASAAALLAQYTISVVSLACVVPAGVFGVCCLWKYGADLHHFEQQLHNFQEGSPITVKDGGFAKTEAQLLEVQARHAEAVRAAVTSERFKVELISNVSHDLRTPLTAILGYGELLQKETLSPEARDQLSRLNQKAGYMRDLVESLFELTKVSSGVIESKKEEIDLIRLLEQTIGLFDDQLAGAGLQVRRHYEMETMPVATDGARMHQVFANLLGNAIKYALAGTRIHLEVKEQAEDCLVRMTNTASYEMDFQPEEIMQRFARGDKARSTQGSGLGLAIAQTYTESVGGSFRVAVDGDQFSAIVLLPKTERNL